MKRSSVQLRERANCESVHKRSKSADDKRSSSESRAYARDRKRAYRASLTKDANVKIGRKETVGIKHMSDEERKQYAKERKRLSRSRKNALVEVGTNATDSGEDDFDLPNDNGECAGEEGTAILNIIQNSPKKKRNSKKRLLEKVKSYLTSRFSLPEQLDVLLVLAHSLPMGVKDQLRNIGINIQEIPKRVKRTALFSNLPKSSKHRHKDQLIPFTNGYTNDVVASTFKQLFITTAELWSSSLDAIQSSWGIDVNENIIPVSLQVTQAADTACMDVSIRDHTADSENKTVKVALMSEAAKTLKPGDRGCVKSLLEKFGTSRQLARKVLDDSHSELTVVEILQRKNMKGVHDTKWPELVETFCFTKPICREAPGEDVSIGYGVRAVKFIRQFSVNEIYNFFVTKYPEFPYKLTVFRTLIPRNLVAPTLRDVKRNICPLHENVSRAIKAFNRFLRKKKAKEMLLPKSTIDICLLLVCNPNPDDQTLSRNPLNWSPQCTKGDCNNCGGRYWADELLAKIDQKELGDSMITFSSWVREEGLDGKKKQILKQEQVSVKYFLENVLFKSLMEEKFPEHLRKAWTQWHITKTPLYVLAGENNVAIRTREDYQQDIKFLCTSETVSTHRGHGVITMLCYPVALEVFKADGTKDLYGLIFLSDSKIKNFDTIQYFEEVTINFVKSKGLTVVRYDRLTDGCSSQFWCYGSMQHLEDMPERLDLQIVNFHRYERYEGKNMSDALGSLLKRKMRAGALMNTKYGHDSVNQLLEDCSDECDLEDLVFGSPLEAYHWIEMCMKKDDSQAFSKEFRSVKLFWVPDEEIPKKLVLEKDCRKIPQVKKYNSVTAVKDRKGVFIRDSTCSFCDNCLKGDVLDCTQTHRNGAFKNFVIRKTEKAASTKQPLNEDNLSDKSDSEEEFEECSEDDISATEESENEDQETPNIEDCTPGRYILFRLTKHKYYLSSIVEVGENLVTLKAARKYGEHHGKITFCWPSIDDVFSVTGLTEYNATALPDPVIDRRGSTLTFRTSAFGKVALSNIM